MKTFSLERANEFVRRFWPRDPDCPKHEQLRRALVDSIVDGFWGPGARLPTESEFASTTPCSLGTVQRALRDLVAQGVIERRRGSGTVVADLNLPSEMPLHMRFFEGDLQEGGRLPIFTQVLSRRLLADHGPWSTHIAPAGQTVVRIDRVFSIDRRLKVYSAFYADAGQFPELVELPEADLGNRNFKSFMARRYHTSVHRVRQALRFEEPPEAVVRHGDCRASAPAAVLNVIAYALNDAPMYYQDFYLPPSELLLDLGISVRA